MDPGPFDPNFASEQNQVVLDEKWGVSPIDLHRAIDYGFCPNVSLIQARQGNREKGNKP
jgi:hypothetical protein